MQHTTATEKADIAPRVATASAGGTTITGHGSGDDMDVDGSKFVVGGCVPLG
jgi:hypothetical protein